MKLTKTAQALYNEMQAGNGYLSVEWGFQYKREFGARNLKAAKELVAAGLIEQKAVHAVRTRNMNATQFVYKIKA